MKLRQVCRSTAQVATLRVQERAVQLGHLEDNIRINFWAFQTLFFEVVNELKRSFNNGSVFVNVFEEIQNRLKQTPLDKKM